MTENAIGPLIFVIAGEPSGDALGARLMQALRERTGGKVRFAGIGGEQMTAEGIESLVPLRELAIMGIVEVLPKARRIFRRVDETVAEIRKLQPQAVVTIDSSGFTWRVAQRLRGAGEKLLLIHYVAPMVWAWRAGRARRMARWYDHLMALLPFEPPYFTAVGLSCAYVGHPVVESGADRGGGPCFRARNGIAANTPLLTVLPGSRGGEVRRHLPIFREAVALLLERHSGLQVVIPTVDTVAEQIAAAVADWPVPVIVLKGQKDKYDAFAASNAAIAASWTVALELAMARLPAIVAYRLNSLSFFLAKRLVKVRYVNLINLVIDQAAVPELLQSDANPGRIAQEIDKLLADPAARQRQVELSDAGLKALGLGDVSPGRRAADEVLKLIAQRELLKA